MEDYFSFQELIKVIRYNDLILHQTKRVWVVS